MAKFSVKKPFTVLVMVLVMIILGIVSVSRMQMDLLPEISLPYIIVITTCPGASPEKVESQISEPMESALGTISGVKDIVSVSNENYGMVQLEFEDGTDMDSAMVKVSSGVNSILDYLPDDCGTPSILEISMDMMATQYLAVSCEGMTAEETSDFVEENVIPMFERQDGVASVSSVGLVDRSVQVELDPEKIEKLNNKILAQTDDAFAEALEQLEDAKKQLEESEDTLEENRQNLVDAQNELEEGKQELLDSEQELADSQSELDDGRWQLAQSRQELDDNKEQLANAKTDTYNRLAEASQALDQLSAYQTQLLNQQAQLQALKKAAEAIEDKIKGIDLEALKSSLAQVESSINTINTILGKLGSSETIPGDELAFLNAILAESGMSVPPGTTYDDPSISFLSPVLTATLSSLKDNQKTLKDSVSQLESATDTLKAYKAEISALEVEIKVTETIIKQYESQLSAMGVDYTDIEKAKMEAAEKFSSAEAAISMGEYQLNAAETNLDSGEQQLEAARDQLQAGWDSLEDGQQQIDDGWEQLEEGANQIKDGWEQYYDSLEAFEKQKAETLRHANADQLVSLSTLSQLIYAQNFEMPAGYIDDQNDNSWLLKVGESYESVDELADIVLCKIDDIGNVKLSDVANITVIDNSLDSYAKVNNDDAVILSIFKSSTAGTNEVSKTCRSLISNLQEKYPGLSIMLIMDQGDYITIIIKSLLESMIFGALLAVIILAVFLKDIRPTLVVALSIPLSVLTAVIALYFSDISLNMMSLSGLALGIGMLVDNSIVVLENIYRLRSRGIEAPRAAVQGTRQVTGSIVASTLTTVCVYFPMVFTTGLVRELMMPMSLAIIFCLMASLLVAMTLIPATSSTLLKNAKPKAHPLFDKIQNAYGKALDFCLRVKIVPILLAVALLALSVWRVITMGIVMLPDMTSNEIQVSVTMPSTLSREECYEKADTIIENIMNIEGVGSLGGMSGGEATLLSSTAGTATTNYTQYAFMVLMEDEEAGEGEVKRVVSETETMLANMGVEYSVTSSMMDTSALLGSGLSISIYGDDLDELTRISKDVMNIVGQVEGFDEITNGQEEPDQVLHLNINKDKAMSLGLTVAQIYMDISEKISNESTAVNANIDGEDMDIVVVTNIDPLSYENILDYTFEVSETGDDGNTYTRDVKLGAFAKTTIENGVESINRENQSRYITVTAGVKDGYNTTLLTRELEPKLQNYQLPDGYTMNIGGEYDSVQTMIKDMILVILLGAIFIYLVMVAQFQSLLSPFIVIFTIPLAFTGGLLGLWISGQNLSIVSLMGFILLLGTVVNNGIVFVDYVNQLRKAGMDRHTALIATGKTRMRPILMTTLTTILAMSLLIFGDDMGSQMGKGMAIVVTGGLLYATLMTLFIVPVMYDILFKKQPLDVDTGSEDLDDVPDDAADYMESVRKEKEKDGSESQADAES